MEYCTELELLCSETKVSDYEMINCDGICDECDKWVYVDMED